MPQILKVLEGRRVSVLTSEDLLKRWEAAGKTMVPLHATVFNKGR